MRKWKRILLQLLENVSSRVVLLFMGEPQVSHVFAKNLYAVRVLPTRRSTSDFFDARHDAKRDLDDIGGVFIDGTEVKLVVCDG